MRIADQVKQKLEGLFPDDRLTWVNVEGDVTVTYRHRAIGIAVVAIVNDQTVRFKGHQAWLDRDLVVDLSKEGKDQYTWDGNKVQYQRELVIRKGDEVERIDLGRYFGKFE